MRINGTVSLVTGGGGMLGAATAARLAELGSSVLVADLTPGRFELLEQQYGDKVQFARTDVTDEQQVQAAVDAASALGELRIVVNCAGAGFVRRTLSRSGEVHSVDAFRQMIELNLIGTFSVLGKAAAVMARYAPFDDGERGVVITTSSLAGLEASAGQIAYGAAKAGVAGLTLPAARDLAPIGVRVMAIAPGGMADESFDATALAADPDPAAQRTAALIAGIAHPKRFGTPEEYALLVTQIVENSYLNGSVIRLDGGARLGLKQ